MFRFLSKALGFTGYVVQYACITHCTFEYVGDFVVCSGPSMEPTLYTNNVLVTERITTRMHKVQRGDIIIARCPTDPKNQICKRVIGLPGDRIIVRPTMSATANPIEHIPPAENKVSSHSLETEIQEALRENNGIDLTTNGLVAAHLKSQKIVIVPRGHIWIEGDNAENSADSRYYGPVPLGLVNSRAVCRVWPINDLKLLI